MRVSTVVAALAAGLLLTATAGAVEVKNVDNKGVELVADLMLAPNKTVADGVVLVVHDTFGHYDMEMLKTLRENLRDRGINTLAPNISYGVSGRRGPLDCSIDHIHTNKEGVDEIIHWYRWVRDRGATSVAVIGHSRGANQVAWFAVDHSKRDVIKAVMLLAPPVWHRTSDEEAYGKRFGKELAPALKEAHRLVMRGRRTERMTTDFLDCPNANVAAGSFVDYYTPDFRRDTPALLGGIKAPTLVVAGSQDEFVGGLTERMKGNRFENVTFQEIAGADHFFTGHAKELADVVAGFLESKL